ncbi:MAG TPA: hypothetical protein VK912_03510 [Longimicrobiales bacterium]|nr:hypothetical protein [Longimicrobiales bacterium]
MRPPTETGRTEPGTWREIIARFERELGPATDADSTGAAAPPTDATTGGALPPAAGEDDRSGLAPTADVADIAKTTDPAQTADVANIAETSDLVTPADVADIAGVEDTTEPLPPATGTDLPGVEDTADHVTPETGTDEEEVAPGARPSLDEAVPWEIAAMTTPDYTPPHSIHDREHDSWPVEAEDGDAVPAWGEDVPEDRAPAPMEDSLEEIGELLLDEEASADPWAADRRAGDTGSGRPDFPLDAFIVPAGVHHAPTGYDADVARRVALRLDELARQLRGGGLQSLGRTHSTDELSRVLAAIVTGYVARDD